MKHTYSIFTLLSVFFILTACQKEPDHDLLPNAPDNRVKTYTEAVTSPNANSSTTFNVSYDNSGRVTGLVSASSPGDKFLFTYPSASLYTMDIFTAGALSIHVDFLLNAASLTDSTFQYNDTYDTSTERYTYNANSQLIRLRQYDYSKLTGSKLYNTTNYTYGSDGNLTKSVDSYGETHTYEYYPNLVYVPPLTVGPVTVASTKKINLIKTHTVTSNGALVGSAAMTYTFDDKDRISTEKSVLNDGSVVVKTYTY